jgi:hypothetical protein
MNSNDLLDAPDFSAPKIAAVGETNWIQPNFCDAILAFNMHVSRLATIASVEEDTIGTSL